MSENLAQKGNSSDDKHLIAKAIEYITGYAVDTNTIQHEANNVAFKYRNKEVWSTLSTKLIDDTIRMHEKSLRGRFEEGGEVTKYTLIKNLKKGLVVTWKEDIGRLKYSSTMFYDKKNNEIILKLETERKYARNGVDKEEKSHIISQKYAFDLYEEITERARNKYIKYFNEFYDTDKYKDGGRTSIYIDDFFEEPHNYRYARLKDPFYMGIRDFDCVQKIKGKYKNIEVVKIVNPRVKQPITYYVFIKKWNDISELKDILLECINDASEYGFTSEEQINAYRKMSEKEYAKGGEAGFDDSDTTLLLYHEKKGNFMIAKNQIYLWLYEGKGINEKLESEEYDYVFYPFVSQNMAWRSDFVPPLKQIWTKKFQKANKGSDKLLGVIKAYLLNDGTELYIDMMSTNPAKKKSGIMSYMIQDLRNTFNLTQDQITFSELTPEGEKFVAKKNYADGGNIEEIKTKYQIAGSDKNGVYTYSKRVADEIAEIYGGNVEEDGSKWYVKLGYKFADGGDTEEVYIEFLNKEKGFKKDIKNFNSYEEAVKWARENFEKFNPDMIKYKYADGGVAETMHFFVVNNKDDKNYGRVGYVLDETKTITDKEGNEFEKLNFENQKVAKKYNVNDLINLQQRSYFTQKNRFGETSFVILVEYESSPKPYYYIYNVTKKFVATEGDLTRVKSNLPKGWKFYDSYSDGGQVYVHKSNPDITLEFIENTNKGIKGLQKNPKSLSKKERKEGIIVYYSDSEMKQLFNKKNDDGGGFEKKAEIILTDDDLGYFSVLDLEKDEFVEKDFTNIIDAIDWAKENGYKVQSLYKYADGGDVDEIKIGDTIHARWNKGMRWTSGIFKGETENGFEVYDFSIEKPKYIEYYAEISKDGYVGSKIYKSKKFKDRNYKNYNFSSDNDDYAKGGDVPHEDKMFQLPLEMVIYVPSTQDVDKVISVDKMDKRVDEVKEYLASKFGGYTSSDKLGGYVDSNGNLVNEDVVQITSFSTKEAFEENKKELIQQIAKWGKDWGQEAIGFEFEGDLMYVPQEL